MHMNMKHRTQRNTCVRLYQWMMHGFSRNGSSRNLGQHAIGHDDRMDDAWVEEQLDVGRGNTIDHSVAVRVGQRLDLDVV